MLNEYNDVLSVDDVCKILHFGRNKVYEMLRTGEIPNKQIRHKYIIPKQGMVNYLSTISTNVD